MLTWSGGLIQLAPPVDVHTTPEPLPASDFQPAARSVPAPAATASIRIGLPWFSIAGDEAWRVHVIPSGDVQAIARSSAVPYPTATKPVPAHATARIVPSANDADSTRVQPRPSSETQATACAGASPVVSPTTTTRSSEPAMPYAEDPANAPPDPTRPQPRPSEDVQAAAARVSASVSRLPAARMRPCHSVTVRSSAV